MKGLNSGSGADYQAREINFTNELLQGGWYYGGYAAA